MASYERDYRVARFVFVFIEVFGWIALGGGVLLALVAGVIAFQAASYYAGAGGAALLAALPGIGIAVAGFFGIAQAQSGRAHVDTAEMTRDLLALARQQAKAAVAAPHPAPAAAPRVKPAAPPPSHSDDDSWQDDPDKPEEDGEELVVETYRGFKIALRNNGYFASDQRFSTKREVKEAIDEAYRRRDAARK